MGSAGWDEVLGAGAEQGDGGAPEDDEFDDDEDAPRGKRVKTSTKVILVVCGWLLLTLFLVGKFSSGNDGPHAVARLESAGTGDGSGDDELVPVETEEDEALDVDGDGFLSAEEQGLDEGTASATAEGGSSAEAGTYEGTPSGSGTGSGGSGAGGSAGGSPSAPIGSAPTTSSTAGGAGATTTSTTAKGTASTAKPANPTTTTTTTSQGGGPPPPPVEAVHITVTATGDDTYGFPQGYSSALSLPAGSTITFDNNHIGTRHSFTIKKGASAFWDSGKIRSIDDPKKSDPLTAGTYTFTCTNEDQDMGGTITVT